MFYLALLAPTFSRIRMDTYSHVLPGLDERAAATVAQLILEGDQPASVSIDKPFDKRDSTSC
jgi:hypothetical protein